MIKSKGRGRPARSLIGQTFGRLTPRRYLEKSVWLCECQCGKEIPVKKWDLETGRVTSCGCEEFLPDPGVPLKPIQKLNFFEILAYDQDRTKALCLCLCGKEFTLPVEGMERVMSCGCIQPAMKKIPAEVRKKCGVFRAGHPLYATWSSMRWSARRRGVKIDPDWDSDFLWFLCWAFSQPAYWQYHQFDRGTGRRMYLARRNTKLGFTPDNCRFHLNRNELGQSLRKEWRY
jgi:hypothetical protein